MIKLNQVSNYAAEQDAYAQIQAMRKGRVSQELIGDNDIM